MQFGKRLKVLALFLGFCAFGSGIYWSQKMGQMDQVRAKFSALEQQYGACERRGYGYSSEWYCPTNDMLQLRSKVASMARDYRDAEEYQLTSFGAMVAIPVGTWFLLWLWTVVVRPIATTSAEIGKAGGRYLGVASSEATKKAVSRAAKLNDSAQGRTRECPFCAEMIKPQAKVCHHCNRDVD